MNLILDVGLGNVGSLLNMLRYLGLDAESGARPAQIEAATRLLLPGVGAFDHGMQRLEAAGIVPLLRERVAQGVPLLAICLGMQLLGHASEEGVRPGLGVLPMRSVRFAPPPDKKLRVPHMGWNECVPTNEKSLLQAVPTPRRFYFVHSYRVVCDEPDCVAGVTSYGGEFVSAVQRGRIYGVQFHPEKSHRCGMALLEHFVRQG
jgi:glutamine amidotransferase